MRACGALLRMLLAVAMLGLPAGGALAQKEEAPAEPPKPVKKIPIKVYKSGELPPYLLVRSLQNIQDRVVKGDLTAVEMQRYLLAAIDKRLRSVDMDVFEDQRNVDSALIYVMSGGNPDVLDVLVERDFAGVFDARVTSILRKYLKGKGGAAVKQLADVVPEYRDTRLGPYLELIGANAVMQKEPLTALKYFNWARIEAPGTLIEEAAIRRSLVITSRNNMTSEALKFAKLYARRFMNSPYATQFADIFVEMALDHSDIVKKEDVEEILSLMDRLRQREIYLRLARRATIIGNGELALFSAERARQLSRPEDRKQQALASLYQNLVNIPSDSVETVLERLAAIPAETLSPKDRFLKQAGEIVAEEVRRPPPDTSLTQVRRDMIEKEYRDEMAERRARLKLDMAPTASTNPADAAGEEKALPTDDFISVGRSKVMEIDDLLSSEGN